MGISMVMTATQIRKTILKIVVKGVQEAASKKLISQLGNQGGSEYGLINNVLY